MHKETLSHIEGVSLFPVIAILIFMVFFLLVLYFTFKMEKRSVAQYAALPINADSTTTSSTSLTHPQNSAS